jgi:hypothetical protein
VLPDKEWGVAVPGYIIKGDCDDACAKLKTTLKAQDAKFEATLQSQFKSPAKPPRPFQPAPMPQQKPAPMPSRNPGAAFVAPAGKPASSTGAATGSMLSSSRNTDDSVRGRLRTSLRSTPPR